MKERIALSAREAARLLGLSESTLAKLRLSGGGPVYSKLGSRVVYMPEDLESWVVKNRRRSTCGAALGTTLT
jgi:predicted DNA-binding transcriptional regulator AlpA